MVKPGDIVIDATCGNGHDTLVLAALALAEGTGSLYALDLQSVAIESSKQMLINKLPKEVYNRIFFYEGCHSKFPEELRPRSVKLISYNLGYLPGGDKTLTTQVNTTLRSIQEAIDLIQEGGLISITCYPGQKTGRDEEDKIIEFSNSLDQKIWSCCHHRWTNRNLAPSLLLIQKRIKGSQACITA